jgi:hypothetical protein
MRRQHGRTEPLNAMSRLQRKVEAVPLSHCHEVIPEEARVDMLKGIWVKLVGWIGADARVPDGNQGCDQAD